MSNPALLRFKLDGFANHYKLAPEELNTDNLLTVAYSAEEKCKQLGPFDPAFPRFKRVQIDFEKAAANLDSLQLQAV